eukprot:TRINITY_DN778142_c0_g1_i1.p1 TRINITY_DN778142_c0_g1~~TRINITY_DN778142_c0_g1_i1.p1  ORF type:complete len:271 (-),score=52.80 TRINITY_DN778142_c0_g1_i1:79-891(-)
MLAKQLRLASNVASRAFSLKIAEETAERIKVFRLMRFDPETDKEPYYQSFPVNIDECGPMYLDALIKIKNEQDATVAFRRSCREGICGSCSVNIDGHNQLSCLVNYEQNTKPTTIRPLPHLPIIRDLVPDIGLFYEQYKMIDPWLKRKTPKQEGEKEFYQSEEDRALIDGLYECVLCACCSTACPSFWWNSEKSFFGPAVLQQVYRWVIDSRDEFTSERLEELDDAFKMYKCHTIMSCTKACPKGLNPGQNIEKLKHLFEEAKANGFQKQ